MPRLATILVIGGLLGGVASTSAYSQELAHAQEPVKTKMVFMTDHGAEIVLSATRCEGFVMLEGPADHVAVVRDGLVQSGLPSGTIIARPVRSGDAPNL